MVFWVAVTALATVVIAGVNFWDVFYPRNNDNDKGKNNGEKATPIFPKPKDASHPIQKIQAVCDGNDPHIECLTR